jgi:hypothetical protein
MKSSVVDIGLSRNLSLPGALDEAFRGLERLKDGYKLVLCYAHPDLGPRRLGQELSRRLRETPWLGCTSDGEITPNGIQHGLALIGISSAGLQASVGSARGVAADPREAGRQAFAQAASSMARIGREIGPRSGAFVLLHGMGMTAKVVGHEDEVMEGIRESAGWPIPIVGGSAGDEARLLQTFQLGPDFVATDGCALALIAPAPTTSGAFGCTHGYRGLGTVVRVTRIRDHVVEELDGRVAADVYTELVGVNRGLLGRGTGVVRVGARLPRFFSSMAGKMGLTPRALIRSLPFYQLTVEHPFGIPDGAGGHLMMMPRMVSPDGFIDFYTPLAEGTELELMRVDRELAVDAPARAYHSCVAQLPAVPDLFLVFECSGRLIYLGEDSERSVARLLETAKCRVVGV